MYFPYYVIYHFSSAFFKVISGKVSGKKDFAIKKLSATWLPNRHLPAQS